MGGLLSQEVIKVISRKEAPFSNFFLFSGPEGVSVIERIFSREELS